MHAPRHAAVPSSCLTGLHDCDTRERVHTDDYAKNLEGIFETLKPAASSVVFVTTTPYVPVSDFVY